MEREAFLARVREAAQAGQLYRVQTEPTERTAGRGNVGGDLTGRLAQEIEAVGGQAHRVASLSQARTCVAKLLEQYAASSVLCWNDDTLAAMGLRELLTERGIERWDYDRLTALDADDRRQAQLAADAGISGVDFAIAETGSLALLSQPGHERNASLLPPAYIAVVRRGQIVADLFDLFDELAARGLEKLPSNLVLVTGPSKTGDIELKLTTGVHGPKYWHVVIVDE
jgi:L-lactate dehydrogenase complex protein LldG